MLSFVMLSAGASAGAVCDNVLLQARGGLFYPGSSLLRDVYAHVGGDFEVEGSVRLYDGLLFWSNFNFFRKRGTLEDCTPTTVHLYPLSFGLKVRSFFSDHCALYVGAGASASFIRINNKYPYLSSHRSETEWGWVIKSGLLFFLWDNVFADLFLDGYYTETPFTKNFHNSGGLRAGLGIGINF